MKEQDQNTEEKILEAAVQEFMEKGKAGARMQTIADTAGINKALLHYYYRSKDKLFESVFNMVIGQLVIPKVKRILEKEDDLFSIIRNFTDLYVTVLNRNPYLPYFIIDEIHKNPGRLSKFFLNAGMPIQRISDIIDDHVREGKIRKIEPQHLLVNILGMCVFPVLGKNMVKPLFFKDDNAAFKKFLNERKTHIAEFVIQSIQIK